MTLPPKNDPSVGNVGLIGASGLIGGAFMEADLGDRIVTFGRRASCNIHLDLAQGCDGSIFEGIDTLVHAAGVRDEDFASDAESAFWRSGYGAVQLFEAAAKAGVSTIVYVSTAHVYGGLRGKVRENTSIAPRSDYASCHYMTECILDRVARDAGIRSVVVRPNAVFGTSYDPKAFSRWNLVPFLFPRLGVEGGRIEVRHPLIERNFVSSACVADTAINALRQAGSEDRLVCNAVGGDVMSMGEYAILCADVIQGILGRKVSVELSASKLCDSYDYGTNRSTSVPQAGELRKFVERYVEELTTSSQEGVSP